MKAGHRAIARAYLDPARPFDRHHYYYALSKLATDPLYDGVCDALRGRDLPVLDVGCGIGLLAHRMRMEGIATPYIGTDFDVRKIRYAQAGQQRSGLFDARFEVGDAASGLPAHSGDVCLLDVLQFLPDDASQDALLESAIARLAPGGKLVIRTGLTDGSARAGITVLVDRLSALWGWMRARPGRYPRLEELRERFARHGLHVEFRPLHGNTPFNNWLVVADKPTESPH
ncbi:MAG: methyltransferase domain-containing protein [Xanthomonadaceae bacterium]|nr:methyltransferase domain-containing protein [Xanthomonadaceae bacterium]